jgi:Ser/Thr protein kinase RdoA (MazF antagonist)
VIGRHGSVVLEEWVEGRSPDGRELESIAADAGALLGRLHATPLEDGEPRRLSTATWRARAGEDLELLAAGGVLAGRSARRLRQVLERADPVDASCALVHMDFTPENWVVDRRGRLRVIDNELVAVKPIALDLARAAQRAPASSLFRERFDGGYRSASGRSPEIPELWIVVAALRSARIALERAESRLPSWAARLRDLAASPERGGG